MIEGPDDGGGPVPEPELGEHVTDVRLHRPLAHEQGLADLGVGRPSPKLLTPDSWLRLSLLDPARCRADLV
jgi:hypothetical protein